MKLLLDTHIFLWWVSGDPQLSATARQALRDPAHERYLSSVTGIEIAIKVGLGKLKLGGPLDQTLREGMAKLRAVELPLKLSHTVGLAVLPTHHRDPFDRLLICQAIDEGMTLVTQDSMIRRYSLNIIS
jgi:PIN domain nuclease of toxin-antitoxin system